MQQQPPSDRQYSSLVFTSWKLIALVYLIAVFPVLGDATWFIGAPILFIALVMGLFAVSRGGAVPGLMIVLMSIITAPVCIAITPFLSKHFGISQMIASLPSSMKSNPEFDRKLQQQRQQKEQQQKERADKDAASINLARAKVFFTNRLYAQSLEEYQHAFRIHSFAPYWNIAQAMCAALCVGDFKAAENIGLMILPKIDWNDPYASYVAMYMILSQLAQDNEREARDLAAVAVVEMEVGEWPYPIMLYLNNEISMETLLENAGSSIDNQTEAVTFIGYKRSYSGETDRAIHALAWVVEKGNKTFLEYPVAKAEHERLSRRISDQVSSPSQSVARPITVEGDGQSQPVMNVEPVAARQVVMKPNGQRFGIMAKKCPQEGIHIETVTAGTSATRCTDVRTGQLLQMEPGDHILSINGIKPKTLAEFLDLIAKSGQEMTFEVKDQRSGYIRKMKTTLAW